MAYKRPKVTTDHPLRPENLSFARLAVSTRGTPAFLSPKPIPGQSAVMGGRGPLLGPYALCITALGSEGESSIGVSAVGT